MLPSIGPPFARPSLLWLVVMCFVMPLLVTEMIILPGTRTPVAVEPIVACIPSSFGSPTAWENHLAVDALCPSLLLLVPLRCALPLLQGGRLSFFFWASALVGGPSRRLGAPPNPSGANPWPKGGKGGNPNPPLPVLRSSKPSFLTVWKNTHGFVECQNKFWCHCVVFFCDFFVSSFHAAHVCPPYVPWQREHTYKPGREARTCSCFSFMVSMCWLNHWIMSMNLIKPRRDDVNSKINFKIVRQTILFLCRISMKLHFFFKDR